MRTSVLLLLALGLACAQAACTVSGSLTARPGAWQANGATNTIYDIVVTNSGTCSINSVRADLALGSCSISSAWNIDTISKNAAITGFGPTLAAGGSFNGAGLIISGSCTPALTLRAECGSCGSSGPTTTPATQAPNPPTTAPPTTRPGTSAPPTNAPTKPPTATPAPTQPPTSTGGCSATVTLVPQSSWVDNSASYATYGISITNAGKCPVTALSVAIAFPAGNSITSSWNYDTNTGAVSGFGDSIPVGATTQSPGIIYKGTAKPTASIKSVTCQASCSGTPTNPTPAPTNPTPAPTNPTPAPTNPTPAPSNPTTAPTTPPVNPTAPPTASPTNPPSQQNASQAVCGIGLIIDNFLYKANQNLGLNAEQTKAKYMSYMADVDKYYTHYFNMRMPLSYVYIETDSSFSDTLDSGKLLTDFQDALKARKFGNAPTDACVYHLLTARQPEGTGGLAYVGTACSSAPDYGNTGYVVDGFGNEDADLVIRRSVHEIGHNLGGNHPDFYQNDPRYTCSVNDDNADLRILRSDKAANEMVERDYVSGYQFLNPLAFISDCATNAIRSQLASFSCLWTTTPLPAARVTFFNDASFGGTAYTLYAYEGISTSVCYNILPFNDQAASHKISGITNPKGITIYQDIDCLGTATTFSGASAADFGSSSDDATSFRFL